MSNIDCRKSTLGLKPLFQHQLLFGNIRFKVWTIFSFCQSVDCICGNMTAVNCSQQRISAQTVRSMIHRSTLTDGIQVVNRCFMVFVYRQTAHKEMDRGIHRDTLLCYIKICILSTKFCHLEQSGVNLLFAKKGNIQINL